MNRSVEDILDIELTRILAGEAGVDDCCARNSDVAAELRPLLTLAVAGREALRVTDIPAEQRQSSRDRLMHQAGNLSRPKRSGRGRWLMRPLALAAGLMLLLSAGTALAASGAEPDSFLYPLKQRLENARTVLAMQNLDKAKAEIGHANARLDELDKMAGEGKPEYIASLLSRYEAHYNDAIAHKDIAAGEGKDTGEVEAMLQATSERHDLLVESLLASGELPDEAAEALQGARSAGDGGGEYGEEQDGGDEAGDGGGSGGHNDQNGSGDGADDSDRNGSGDSGDTGGSHESDDPSGQGGQRDGSDDYSPRDPDNGQGQDGSGHAGDSGGGQSYEEASKSEPDQDQPHYESPHVNSSGTNKD